MWSRKDLALTSLRGQKPGWVRHPYMWITASLGRQRPEQTSREDPTFCTHWLSHECASGLWQLPPEDSPQDKQNSAR